MSIAAQLDLARAQAWRYEPRGLHGEWVGAGGLAGRYDKPDHSRLVNPNARDYKDPGDHPWFKDHAVDPKNIVTAYDAATPEQKQQGMRWYSDAHNIATMIGGGNAEKGAGLLAAYSPQTSWPVNMFNAARAAKEGRALGPGDGMITGAMQRSAQRMINGESIEDVMGGSAPKINSFAKLIKNGGDAPDDRLGQVVMDRHALSVAVGRRLTKAEVEKSPVGKQRYYEHIADTYREAAHQISQRDGTDVSPSQLQAITWLQRQQANQAEDEARGLGGSALDKGRQKMTSNAWNKWGEYARQHHIPVSSGTTVLSQLYADTLSMQFAELGEAMELAAWEHELRDPHGAWTTDDGVMHLHGSLGIDRADMPQLTGTRADGSYVGSAEMHPKFIEHLQSKGITVTHERVPASSLHPTQSTAGTDMAHQIARRLVSGEEPDTKPVFASSEGRILDGHNTWAARQVAAESKPGLASMRVTRVHVPIGRLMDEAAEFAARQGIQSRAHGEVANPAYQAGRYTVDPATIERKSWSASVFGYSPSGERLVSLDGGKTWKPAAASMASITGQFLDLTGDGHGHHIPGTPYVYRHGWKPIAPVPISAVAARPVASPVDEHEQLRLRTIGEAVSQARTASRSDTQELIDAQQKKIDFMQNEITHLNDAISKLSNQEQDRKSRMKLALHAGTVAGGAILAALSVPLTAGMSPVIGAGVVAAATMGPGLIQELFDFYKKL